MRLELLVVPTIGYTGFPYKTEFEIVLLKYDDIICKYKWRKKLKYIYFFSFNYNVNCNMK